MRSQIVCAATAFLLLGVRFCIAAGEGPVAGSVAPGDFVVLDQDILKLADEGHADEIRNTAVLETWFMGKSVYVGKGRNLSAQRGLTQ